MNIDVDRPRPSSDRDQYNWTRKKPGIARKIAGIKVKETIFSKQSSNFKGKLDTGARITTFQLVTNFCLIFLISF